MYTAHNVLWAEAAQLERLALDRYSSQHSELQLSRVVSLGTRYESVAVGSGWRLAHKAVNEEVVGYFQGVIYKQDLPPFVEKIRYSFPFSSLLCCI